MGDQINQRYRGMAYRDMAYRVPRHGVPWHGVAWRVMLARGALAALHARPPAARRPFQEYLLITVQSVLCVSAGDARLFSCLPFPLSIPLVLFYLPVLFLTQCPPDPALPPRDLQRETSAMN